MWPRSRRSVSPPGPSSALTGRALDIVVLLLAIPTVSVITQTIAIAVQQRERSIDLERRLSATAIAIAGTVDRSEIARIGTSAAIDFMPSASAASAHLSPAGYGLPAPDEGLALSVPGRSTRAAFLVVKVNGDVPSDARHALRTLAETIGRGLFNADAFDTLREHAGRDPLTDLPNRPATWSS